MKSGDLVRTNKSVLYQSKKTDASIRLNALREGEIGLVAGPAEDHFSRISDCLSVLFPAIGTIDCHGDILEEIISEER
jgi:hypothetical protein